MVNFAVINDAEIFIIFNASQILYIDHIVCHKYKFLYEKFCCQIITY